MTCGEGQSVATAPRVAARMISREIPNVRVRDTHSSRKACAGTGDDHGRLATCLVFGTWTVSQRVNVQRWNIYYYVTPEIFRSTPFHVTSEVRKCVKVYWAPVINTTPWKVCLRTLGYLGNSMLHCPAGTRGNSTLCSEST